MKRVTLALALFAAISFSAAAQEFTPYPYIQLQGGVSYDFSEAADFAKLLSPAAQVAVGYRFDELWGARLAVNGWNAKHTSQDTETLYGFQFVQPNLDLILDWSSALFGWGPERPVTVYIFVGAGAAPEAAIGRIRLRFETAPTSRRRIRSDPRGRPAWPPRPRR